MNTCHKCLCSRCGKIHQCEAILDMLMYYDAKNYPSCSPNKTCSNFSSHRNMELNKKWECPVKQNLGGDCNGSKE